MNGPYADVVNGVSLIRAVGAVMDTIDCLKEAEKCERLARACVQEASRAFFVDAADYWRHMALRTKPEQEQPPTRDIPVLRREM